MKRASIALWTASGVLLTAAAACGLLWVSMTTPSSVVSAAAADILTRADVEQAQVLQAHETSNTVTLTLSLDGEHFDVAVPYSGSWPNWTIDTSGLFGDVEVTAPATVDGRFGAVRLPIGIWAADAGSDFLTTETTITVRSGSHGAVVPALTPAGASLALEEANAQAQRTVDEFIAACNAVGASAGVRVEAEGTLCGETVGISYKLDDVYVWTFTAELIEAPSAVTPENLDEKGNALVAYTYRIDGTWTVDGDFTRHTENVVRFDLTVSGASE